MKGYTLEVAVTDFATAAAAVEGGADRIELCTALSEGGLTPSFGLIEQCRQKFDLPLFPILRPRAGDFLYTAEEYEIILKDALLCKRLGCDGVVIGFLEIDGTIDVKRTAALVNAVYPLEVTFHRAFDRCKDPLLSLEAIINAGCQRLLTSGQQLTAWEGRNLIKELVSAAADRISIMPGSGVQAQNIKELYHYTGATEFHGSLRSKAKSSMHYLHPAFAHSAESYRHAALQPETVRAVKKAMDEAITLSFNTVKK